MAISFKRQLEIQNVFCGISDWNTRAMIAKALGVSKSPSLIAQIEELVTMDILNKFYVTNKKGAPTLVYCWADDVMYIAGKFNSGELQI